MKEPNINSSYNKEDVTFLLKDIGDSIEELSASEREKAVQNGIHYSETLPLEYVPSNDYMKLYEKALKKYSLKIAKLVGITSELILRNRGKNVVLVSLARAGTPIGVLIYRYLKMRYNIEAPHYAVSIIRGKGIDETAMHYILSKYKDKNIIFIDGWTGKGAISKVLTDSINDFNKRFETRISSELAVLTDPGYCAEITASFEDFLIPSACLNSTISGLVSRTFHRSDIIGEKDFHGARFYENLSDNDYSLKYIDEIEKHYKKVFRSVDEEISKKRSFVEIPTWEGYKSILNISKEFGIDNINYVKPGIGETTRVLLRREPWKILVRPDSYKHLEHILQLAKDKNVEIVDYPNMTYACCGLVKQVSNEVFKMG